jgi:hypothetical protein
MAAARSRMYKIFWEVRDGESLSRARAPRERTRKPENSSQSRSTGLFTPYDDLYSVCPMATLDDVLPQLEIC